MLLSFYALNKTQGTCPCKFSFSQIRARFGLLKVVVTEYLKNVFITRKKRKERKFGLFLNKNLLKKKKKDYKNSRGGQCNQLCSVTFFIY